MEEQLDLFGGVAKPERRRKARRTRRADLAADAFRHYHARRPHPSLATPEPGDLHVTFPGTAIEFDADPDLARRIAQASARIGRCCLVAEN